MRVANAVHEAGGWRIRDIAPDFVLEDAWDLPVRGRAEDFPALVRLIASSDPLKTGPSAVRMLWRVRERIGAVLGLDEDNGAPLPIPGTDEVSLAGRLPGDLRGTAGLSFGSLPFAPLYRTADEFAAEISNKTVHGVLHVSWVERGGGDCQGRLAVYVKPRGRMGKAYMRLIKPFRHRIVYPALLRGIGRAWTERGSAGS